MVFLTSAITFAVGAVLAAVFFPSKARLAELRESVSTIPAVAHSPRHQRIDDELLDEVGARRLSRPG